MDIGTLVIERIRIVAEPPLPSQPPNVSFLIQIIDRCELACANLELHFSITLDL